MKKKIALVFVSLMIMLSVILTGCNSGISQADLDAVNAQLSTVQAQLDKALDNLASAAAEKTAATDVLQSQVNELNEQIAALKDQYEMEGLTTLETVAKMAKAYYDSHYYIRDVYDCNNYASDFWDMLKQVGISSVIVIGNKDTVITDILTSNHAWVLVDLGNGEKVVVDPTGGMVVYKTDNPLYYKGWTFSTPADLKANDDLKAAYNARVSCVNTLVTEINSAMNLYNNSSTQVEADKYFLLYNKLKEIKEAQETILNQVRAQIDAFSTRIDL